MGGGTNQYAKTTLVSDLTVFAFDVTVSGTKSTTEKQINPSFQGTDKGDNDLF